MDVEKLKLRILEHEELRVRIRSESLPRKESEQLGTLRLQKQISDFNEGR